MSAEIKFAVIERSGRQSGINFSEAEVIEVPASAIENTDTTLKYVRVDTVPQDTIAKSPDDALRAAQIIQDIGNERNSQLGFKIEYMA